MSADTIIGLLAYTTASVATQPLDYMKVQAQARYANHHTANPRPLLFGRATVSVGGFSSLYIGADALVARSLVYHYIRSNIFLALVQRDASRDRYGSVPTYRRTDYQVTAAAIGGFIATPLDLILLRRQVDNTLETPRGYTSLMDGIARTAKEGGSRALWVGGTANAMKYGGLALGMMPVYDYFIEWWARVLGDVFCNKALALSMAAMAGCALSMPFDNIKTKLQRQLPGGIYSGNSEALLKTITREGFLGLYVGYWHYYARVSVSGLLTILLVDSMRATYYG